MKQAGGWIGDGRVCDVLAVSRAFGDWEFKAGNTDTLLEEGIKYEWWDQSFASKVNITGDLVIVTPDVSKTDISEEAGDEFVIVASDGLWCAPRHSDRRDHQETEALVSLGLMMTGVLGVRYNPATKCGCKSIESIARDFFVEVHAAALRFALVVGRTVYISVCAFASNAIAYLQGLLYAQ